MKNNKNIKEKLLSMAYKLSSSLDLQFILSKITEERTLSLLSTKRATIYLLDDNKEFLVPVATLDPPNEAPVMSQKIAVKSSLSGKVVKSKRGMIFNNTSQQPDAYQIPGTLFDEDENLMVLPLIVENNILGTINLYRRMKLFSNEDIEIGEIFALYASTAIQNAIEHQQLIREINERNAAEEELHENEEIFNLFFEHSPIYVFFKDKNIRSLRLSKNYEQMLERPISELIGKNMDDLFPSDIAKKMVADDIRILKEGKPVTIKEEFNNRYYETTKFPIQINGKDNYLAGFTTDITEKKIVEDELKESEEKYRDLVEKSNIAILIEDKDGKFTYFNESFPKLFGYTADEIKNTINSDLVHPDDFKKVMEYHNKRISGKNVPSDYEHRAIKKDGSTIYLSLNVIPVMENNMIIGTRSYIWDITKRLQVEKRLKSRNVELEIFNEAAVNRELTMIELKKEINELLISKGEKPKYKIIG